MIHPFQREERAEYVADVLKSLANPCRLRILALLCQRERTVSELCEALDAPPSTVSGQLRILRLRRFVEVTRSGSFATYRVGHPDVYKLLDSLECCSLLALPKPSTAPEPRSEPSS